MDWDGDNLKINSRSMIQPQSMKMQQFGKDWEVLQKNEFDMWIYISLS